MALHRPLCPDGRVARDPEATAPCPESSRPYVLAATILASAMGFIDGTVVTIALPSIQKDFGADFVTLQWVSNSYALMLGSLILVGGGAGDKFGRRLVFLAGIGLFVLASVGCALAPGLILLIFARICQGIGAALMIPQSLAIIAASFPKDVRGRAIGIWAGASAITTALGPPLGGFLIDTLSWRAAFWINVPIAAVSVWLSLQHVPESRNDDATGALDWLGGLLAVIGFGAITLALTTASQTASLSASALIWFGVGVLGVVAFIVTERRAKQPLMPPSLFANKAFTGTNLTTLLLYGAFTAVLFLLPFDLINLRNYSSAEVGLIMLPIGVIIGIASAISGRQADRSGPRNPLLLGSLIVAVSAGIFALNLANFWLGVMTPMLVMSIGMALVVAPLTTAVMNSAPDALSGAASGINNAASRLAGLFAVAIVGSAATIIFLGDLAGAGLPNNAPHFGNLPDASSPDRAALEAAFRHGYSMAMLIAAVFGVLAALVAYVTLTDEPSKLAEPGEAPAVRR